jgi:hypothetical protein
LLSLIPCIDINIKHGDRHEKPSHGEACIIFRRLVSRVFRGQMIY